MEQEITTIDKLSIHEETLLNAHSVLNVMNIIIGELSYLKFFVKNRELLNSVIEKAHYAKEFLLHPSPSIVFVYEITSLRDFILTEIEKVFQKEQTDTSDPNINESLENIQTIFTVLLERAHELDERNTTTQKWKTYTIEELHSNFSNVFASIAQNSKGRYSISYNKPSKGANDYGIYFNIVNGYDYTITIPPVLIDVMRDLAANARKYSPPGSTINAALIEDINEITFAVEDHGVGIPEKQITKVVNFGVRGSNVMEKGTYGGGFGLTKAFTITREYGGRMWISSELGKGTRIKISIPKTKESIEIAQPEVVI